MSKEAAIAQIKSDIEAGTEIVGDWYMVDQTVINKFAEATEDRQWIHVDPERAKKESPYKDTIAHGFLSLSLTPFLTGSVKPGPPRYEGAKMGVNYGLNKVRFPAPVMVGTRIRTRSRQLEVSEVPGGIQVVTQVTIEAEGSDKPACVAEQVGRTYF